MRAAPRPALGAWHLLGHQILVSVKVYASDAQTFDGYLGLKWGMAGPVLALVFRQPGGKNMRQLLSFLIFATVQPSAALAKDRAISSNEVPQQYEVASYEFNARSFFEPKTEADVSALVSLDQDLERSLSQEELN